MRSPYGSTSEKIEAIARDFDLKRSAAHKYIAALKVLEEHPELQEVHDHGQVSPDALLLIKTAGDPEAAIALYTDRTAVNPNYSIASFRQELKQGVTDSMEPPPLHHACPSCGQWHLVKEP